MNEESRMSLRWPVAVALAVLLLALGAAASYVFLTSAVRPTSTTNVQTPAAPTAPPTGEQQRGATPTASSDQPLPDAVVTLSAEAVHRARITVVPVASGASVSTLRLPATVEANGYRQVGVTPVVGGRVTRVLSELGGHVRQGQTMAQVFSPELAEAQTRYVSIRAELDAHERELERTEKLVKIGAASRQELERIHAEHTARKSSVESARSRLQLLGLPRSAIDDLGPGKEVEAIVNVPAPIAGVVTERLANVGLNVDPATKLFAVVDLSTVWVVADLYEKDFSRVRTGDSATVVTTAYPDRPFKGRISYIDPQVNAQTRTAKLRVEVPNPHTELRLGMFAEVQVESSDQTSVTLIPRSAVQHVADRSVVYLVNPSGPGQFTEREVRMGQQTGDRVEVLAGVAPSDSVVSEGSFFLRAESERLGLRQSVSVSPPITGGTPSPQSRAQSSASDVQTATVIVGEQGYQPAKVSLRASVPARLTFVRITDKTCGTEVVFPSLNIERALPLNQPVDIEFTPAKSGDIAFACGMNMLHGTVVVR
jgi:cobalt-zinc-cadmium efflux system membrane fusion protein